MGTRPHNLEQVPERIRADQERSHGAETGGDIERFQPVLDLLVGDSHDERLDDDHGNKRPCR